MNICLSMTDISSRIRELVDDITTGNVLKFASQVGTSDTNIRNYMNGRKPSVDVLSAISENFNINLQWLLTGKGNKYLNDTNIVSEAPAVYQTAQHVDDKQTMYVPLVGEYAYGGYVSGYSDPEYIKHLPTVPFVVEDKEYRGQYLAFEVRGDSMDDGTIGSYPAHSIVLAREIQRQHWTSKLHINKWDFVIVHKDGIMIKRIIDHDVENGIITCHSLNDMYKDYDVHLDDVQQIFNVVKRVIDVIR